jgi:hypothetical protein
VLLDVRPQRRRLERAGRPEGLLERPATLRQHETLWVTVQVSTATRHSASRIGEQDSLDHNDAQQV